MAKCNVLYLAIFNNENLPQKHKTFAKSRFIINFKKWPKALKILTYGHTSQG